MASRTAPELPSLNRALVASDALRACDDVAVPGAALLDLPEKAIQFGTGAFLRGFVECILDDANRNGRFGGRVVMIGSTGTGRADRLSAQDGLYTLSVQGIVDGAAREELRIVSSVSRALSAGEQWDAVLECARNPALELVFSNTTEVGIALDERDRFDMTPPASFPGKLTRFLYERAQCFDFDPARGVVILPCELIEQNGERLRGIVLELARRWSLDPRFARWIGCAVPFCNTLVDRIVPGAPQGGEAERLERILGYRDDMLTVCETYRLFAIEGVARDRLPFSDEAGVIVARDIRPYRERKVRLLNGTHTIMVPTALLAGCETVRAALEHGTVGRFVRSALLDDIVPSVDVPGAEEFAHAVLDRFANPYIHHALVDITLQQTMKMRVRVVPSIVDNVRRCGRLPRSLVFGFAGYLEYMRVATGGPADDQGASVRARWERVDDSPESVAALVRDVCADTSLWTCDLTTLPGFAPAVTTELLRIRDQGALGALETHLSEAAVWQ
jgi:tagaturonate reductase